MWYVALGWRAIEFVQTSAILEFYIWFPFPHITAVDMSFCTSLRNFIQIGPPSAEENKKLCCRKEARDASCLYNFNKKRRAQSFIISCLGFRYTTACNQILFCSLLFGVFVHAAGRHKQTFAGVHCRLCDLHCMVVGNCFCHFVVRTSSNLR